MKRPLSVFDRLLLSLQWLLFGVCMIVINPAGANKPDQIGLVVQVQGVVDAVTAQSRQSLRLLDPLISGAEINLSDGAGLAFSHHPSSKVFRLTGPGKYRLNLDGVQTIEGSSPQEKALRQSASLVLSKSPVVSGATRLRSGMELLQLTQPLNRIKLRTAPLAFEWNCPDDAEFLFEIRNEARELVFSQTTRDRFVRLQDWTLPAGSYQWRVSYDDVQSNFKQMAQGVFTLLSPEELRQLEQILLGFTEETQDQLLLIHVLLEGYFYQEAKQRYELLRHANPDLSIPRLNALGL